MTETIQRSSAADEHAATSGATKTTKPLMKYSSVTTGFSIRCSLTDMLTLGRSMSRKAAETGDSDDSSNKDTNPKNKKRVRFSHMTNVLVTISRQDISPKEKFAAWFSRDECDAILKDCCKQIRKMEGGSPLMGGKYCARGLESHTHCSALAKTLNRSVSIQSVVVEQQAQHAQRGVSFYDDDAIALVYHNASASSQMWAHTVGLRDQREAEDILDEFLDTLDEMSAAKTTPSEINTIVVSNTEEFQSPRIYSKIDSAPAA